MLQETRSIIIGIVICTYSLIAVAQVTPSQLQNYLSGNNSRIINPLEVNDFYNSLSYKLAWIGNENVENLESFSKLLEKAAYFGLNQQDYDFSFVESIKSRKLQLLKEEDSIKAELRITGSALHFFSDMAYGNIKPFFGYFGLEYWPTCRNISASLAQYVSAGALTGLSDKLCTSFSEIQVLLDKIKWLQAIVSSNRFEEQFITMNTVNAGNSALVKKLFYLRLIDTLYINIPDSTLKQKVKEAQKQFGLLADGRLRSTILAALNVPVKIRLQQLTLSVNYYRWLSCLQQNSPVVVVNIPAAYLKVYNADSVILEMRMVVGKKSTPTPSLASTINEVILYPYWYVPHSIAVKELLPAIKKSRAVLDEGNYLLMNSSGKIIDPATVNWRAITRNYFPYIIRQSSGCDNSLGILKLNFNSSFGVYLHDTPMKYLFMLNKRYFSHGCMRMEKPMELAHMILKNNNVAIDTLTEMGCLLNKDPVIIPADIIMPVIVWYNPAAVDSTGRVLYYEDIYEKFGWMK